MALPVEFLVFAAHASGTEELVGRLQEEGFHIDLVTELGDARSRFLDRGGHALLILAPGVGTGRAIQVIDELRAVDDHLPVVVYGSEVLRDTGLPNIHRIRSFHPASRAGIGALRQVLCSLPRV